MEKGTPFAHGTPLPEDEALSLMRDLAGLRGDERAPLVRLPSSSQGDELARVNGRVCKYMWGHALETVDIMYRPQFGGGVTGMEDLPAAPALFQSGPLARLAKSGELGFVANGVLVVTYPGDWAYADDMVRRLDTRMMGNGPVSLLVLGTTRPLDKNRGIALRAPAINPGASDEEMLHDDDLRRVYPRLNTHRLIATSLLEAQLVAWRMLPLPDDDLYVQAGRIEAQSNAGQITKLRRKAMTLRAELDRLNPRVPAESTRAVEIEDELRVIERTIEAREARRPPPFHLLFFFTIEELPVPRPPVIDLVSEESADAWQEIASVKRSREESGIDEAPKVVIVIDSDDEPVVKRPRLSTQVDDYVDRILPATAPFFHQTRDILKRLWADHPDTAGDRLQGQGMEKVPVVHPVALPMVCVAYVLRLEARNMAALVDVLSHAIGRDAPPLVHQLRDTLMNAATAELVMVAADVVLYAFHRIDSGEANALLDRVRAVTGAEFADELLHWKWRLVVPDDRQWTPGTQTLDFHRQATDLEDQFEELAREHPPADRQLHHYQWCGARWMFVRELAHAPGYVNGGILAMQTGLGKTLTAVYGAYILSLVNPGTTLIVCPLAVVQGWVEEIRGRLSFLPADRLVAVMQSDIATRLDAERRFGVEYHFIVTNPEQLDKTYGGPWARVIVDESHLTMVKPKNKRYQSVALSKARSKFLLTGTPIRRQVEDIVHQVEVCTGGRPLTAAPKAKDRVPAALECLHCVRYGPLTYPLPPFASENLVEFDLSPAELELLYVVTNYCRLVRDSGNRGTILAAIGFARQAVIAASTLPATVLDDMADMARALEQARETSAVSQLFGMVKRASAPLFGWMGGMQAMAWIRDRHGLAGLHSSRMEAVRRVLNDFFHRASADEKMVIVSWYKEALFLVRDIVVAEFGQRALEYHGDVKPADRAKNQHTFLTSVDPGHRCLLLSYATGGAGLNLQRANHILLVDADWSDATTRQAIARIQRINQDRPLHKYELRSSAWIDTRLHEVRQAKADRYRETVGPDAASWVAAPDEEDIRSGKRKDADMGLLERILADI